MGLWASSGVGRICKLNLYCGWNYYLMKTLFLGFHGCTIVMFPALCVDLNYEIVVSLIPRQALNGENVFCYGFSVFGFKIG